MRGLMQLVLDMFDAPPPPAQKPRHRKIKPSEPFVAGEYLSDVLPPANYRHPKASRHILLGGTHISYAFKRSKRRTIGMAIGADGLEVSAPRWVSLAEVESALLEKSDWIERKLVEMGERQAQLGAAKIVWRDGVVIPYLGGSLQVVVDSSPALKKGSAQFEPAAQGTGQHSLRVGLPLNAEAAKIRDAVQAWLMRQAKALFIQRLNHFAPQLGVRWHKLSLSSAATRWGSASADGSIRLNWRLIHHKLDVIDYVVAHELSHLRVMNHSPRFWETVKSVMPDYALHKQVLREQTLPPWG